MEYVRNAFNNVVVPILYFGLTPALFIALVRREDYWSALLLPFAMLFIVGWISIQIGALS